VTVEDSVRELRRAAGALEQDIEDEHPRRRLRHSVIRPLDHALRRLASTEGPGAVDHDPPTASRADPGASAAEDVLDLARRATRLRVEHDIGLPLEVLEAVAGLQHLAVTLAPDDAAPRRVMFADLQAPLPTTIHTEADGPYLVTNLHRLRSWLGVDMSALPQMALCRCGQSASKPLCDGTHADIGFTDGKDPKRVPDRLDTYVGVQVTVRDNRGTCAHSGFCTDRLPTVFRREAETFVAPSGGRMDEIVRAVGGCPSGALSLAAEEHEARVHLDQDREPAVEVSKDGPYRITGGIPLLDAQREPMPRNAGASVEHYSLCRCGQSRSKPFCSGTHWYVEFHDPPLSDEPSLFEWAGGFTALRRMTHIFYEKHVPEEPLLAPLFAAMSPDHPDRVAAWLGETFGGPALHTDLRRLRPDGVPAHGQGSRRGATGTVGEPDDPVGRRGRPADRPRVPRGVRVLHRVGFAHRGRELRARRQAPTAHAGAALVVGLRGHARIPCVGAGDRPRRRRGPATGALARPRRDAELRGPHQAAVPHQGPPGDALLLRPVVPR